MIHLGEIGFPELERNNCCKQALALIENWSPPGNEAMAAFTSNAVKKPSNHRTCYWLLLGIPVLIAFLFKPVVTKADLDTVEFRVERGQIRVGGVHPVATDIQ